MFKIFSGCVLLLVLLSISGIIGGFCFPYAINAWLIFLGKPAAITYWQGFALGYVPWFGQISIPFAVVTWVLMMFLI